MKTLTLLATLCLVAAVSAAEEGNKPQDSPLVKAAKASGGPKKKAKKKVITNADVKSSTGKLVALPPKDGAPALAGERPAEASAPPSQKGPLAKQDDEHRARQAAAARLATAEKKVGELEKELRRLEDAYYAENDPNYRDSTLEQRFNQTKRQLEDARRDLADARDLQQKMTTRSQ